MDIANVAGPVTEPITAQQKVAPTAPAPAVKAEPAAAPATPAPSSEQQALADEMISKSIEQANESLAKFDRRIDRAVHETTNTMIYKIVDTSKDDEVVQEFPARKIQDMIAKMWELAGLVVDEKA